MSNPLPSDRWAQGLRMRLADAYVHESRIGVLVEFESVDDFTARTDVCRGVARDIATQIAASTPISVDAREFQNVVSMLGKIRLSDETEKALMTQPFIEDPSKTVADRIREAKLQPGASSRSFASQGMTLGNIGLKNCRDVMPNRRMQLSFDLVTPLAAPAACQPQMTTDPCCKADCSGWRDARSRPNRVIRDWPPSPALSELFGKPAPDPVSMQELKMHR